MIALETGGFGKASAVLSPPGERGGLVVQDRLVKRSVVLALSPSESKRVVAGIVGDVGPSDELGEASVAMNRSLNGLPETELPKHRRDATERFQVGRTAVLVFPGEAARLARPITPQRVAEAGADVVSKFGGVDKLYSCIRDEIDAAF